MSDDQRYKLTEDELKGLPKKLLNQLRHGSSQSTSRNTLVLIMESFGKEGANLDQILVSYYRKTGEIKKRANLNQQLRDMVRTGRLKKLDGVGRYSGVGHG